MKTEKLIILKKEIELEKLRHENRMKELEKEQSIIKERQNLELEVFRIKNAEYKRRDIAKIEREKDLIDYRSNAINKSKNVY